MAKQWLRSIFPLFAFCFSFLNFAQALTIDTFDGVASVRSPADGVAPSIRADLSSGAIGGARSLATYRSSGDLDIVLSVKSGKLNHSQDAGVLGNSRVVWDGDTDTSSINYDGLGGIDLTQDGGDSFSLDVYFLDYGTIKVRIEIFDASDPSGNKSSQKTITLSATTTEKIVTVPFSDLEVSGIAGGASIKNVGAIVLTMLGENLGNDLTLADFGTNGKCQITPDSNGRVIDDCGVCGGKNQDKDLCGICSGGNKDMDDCGVCFGKNKDVDSCGVCNGHDSSKDQCGICGGDNSSCKDCAGVPNGGAKYDICGICNGDGKTCLDCAGTPFGLKVLDACGVCGGDGKSCIKCTESSIQALLDSMGLKSGDQLDAAKLFLEGLKKYDRKQTKKISPEVLRLYNELVAKIKEISPTVLDCVDTPLCVKTTKNEEIIVTYQKTVTELYKISIDILNKIRKSVPKGGKCKGDKKECEKRVKDRAQANASMQRLAKKLRVENITLSKQVPSIVIECQ